MKKEVKSLWHQCFNDSEEFIDLYFEMKYKDEINMAVYENGQMISALQMIPYPMTFCNTIIPTSYISGACTHPEFRDRGAMKQLLTRSFERMYSERVAFTTLIPAEEWLFDYYRKSGYATTFYYSIEELESDSLPSVLPAAYTFGEYTPFQTDVYSYLNRKMMQRSCYIQHTPEDFKAIVADLYLSNGKLFVLRMNSEITGIAFCIPKADTVYITELLTENEAIRNMLIKAVASTISAKHISLVCPPKRENRSKLGMARIIHAERVLGLFAGQYKGSPLYIDLTDNILQENNGYYVIQNGKYERPSGQRNIHFQKYSIEELTQLILNPQKPYMSLMLN